MNKQQITNNIKIPNQDIEILKKHFSYCFDKKGDFDFEKFKKELQSKEVGFSQESYGMDWLGKTYARLLASDSATTLLKEDKEWNTKPANKNSQNLLLKGDNLEVLKHLSNAYSEQVKMIYIDPPYNTGSDGFVYQDDRKFTVQELQKLAGVDEEEAKRIFSFVNSKSNSHSAWLTFMYPRLYIAKQLLKDDGVIFVSIDDNEVAQLRILMDEIFGEDNFVAQITWRKSDNQANIGQMARVKEYIVGYAKIKDKSLINKIPLTEKAKKEYSYKDNKGSFRRSILLDKTRGRNYYDVTTKNGKILNGPWMIKENEFKKLDIENKILWTSSGEEQPYGKIYLEDSLGQIANDFWDTKFGSNQEASLKLEDLFEKRVFDFPKSTILLNILITLGSNSSDLILDFFAGSGTTGDAVMQLNAEDKANGKEGNRKYILVQIPEAIDPKKNKTAFDFVQKELGVDEPTIFEITKERLVRAGKKIQAEQKDKKDLFTTKNEQDFGFKIFETMPIWEDYEFEAEKFDPQLSLFEESKLTPEDIQTLLTTWKTADNIPLTVDLQKIDLGGYVGYYSDKKLYLMDKGFATEHLKKLLAEIDDNKEFSPASITVFGYHFESKTLREIAENVASYANKKRIPIKFITGY
jgi:adenine-specific DNA-methyltransferase